MRLPAPGSRSGRRRSRTATAICRAATRCRHRSGRGTLLQLLPQARRREMAVVAGEQLVAAVAGQRDRHLLAGEAADQMGRDLRADRRTARRTSPGSSGMTSRASRTVTIALVVHGAEMRGDRPGMLGLVERRLLEPDREGADRDRRIFLIERRRSSSCRSRPTGRRRPARRPSTGRRSPRPAPPRARPAPPSSSAIGSASPRRTTSRYDQ